MCHSSTEIACCLEVKREGKLVRTKAEEGVFQGRRNPEFQETHPGGCDFGEGVEDHSLVESGCSQCSHGSCEAGLDVSGDGCSRKDKETAIGGYYVCVGNG